MKSATEFGLELMAAHGQDFARPQAREYAVLFETGEGWLAARDLVVDLVAEGTLSAAEAATAAEIARARGFSMLSQSVLDAVAGYVPATAA